MRTNMITCDFRMKILKQNVQFAFYFSTTHKVKAAKYGKSDESYDKSSINFVRQDKDLYL